MISQKTHLTGRNLIFFYFLKLNKLSSMAICPKKVRKKILYYVLYCKKSNFVSYFLSKKKRLNKKHLSPKLWELRICIIFDICQFFLKPMALRYIEKLTTIWKCAYSDFPEFWGQILSCKIGVKRDKKLPFFLLRDLKMVLVSSWEC